VYVKLDEMAVENNTRFAGLVAAMQHGESENQGRRHSAMTTLVEQALPQLVVDAILARVDIRGEMQFTHDDGNRSLCVKAWQECPRRSAVPSSNR
jgi:hypothetical protein